MRFSSQIARPVRVLLVAALVLTGLLAFAPAALAYPCCGPATAEISATALQSPGPVTVTVKGTTPGPLTMQLLSTPVTIGTGTVGGDRTGTVSGEIPDGYTGTHTIHVTGAGGEIFDFTVQITTAPRGCCSGPTQAPPPHDTGGLASTGAQVALASGVGLAVLLAGLLIMVVARPRRAGSPGA